MDDDREGNDQLFGRVTRTGFIRGRSPSKKKIPLPYTARESTTGNTTRKQLP